MSRRETARQYLQRRWPELRARAIRARAEQDLAQIKMHVRKTQSLYQEFVDMGVVNHD